MTESIHRSTGAFSALLPAAGRSVRYGKGSKLLEPLAGRLVIVRAIEAFLVRSDVRRIVIAAAEPAAMRGFLEPHLKTLPHDQDAARRVIYVSGGTNRAESVRNALHAAIDSAAGGGNAQAAAWVAVHDAARPLVSQALISRTWNAAQKYGAAAPAMPVPWTIKEAAGPLPAKVRRTVPRQQLWAMQTPQIMRADHLQDAFSRCPISLADVTDDVQLLELCGHEVWLVAGEERNLKITTPADLAIANWWLTQGQGVSP